MIMLLLLTLLTLLTRPTLLQTTILEQQVVPFMQEQVMVVNGKRLALEIADEPDEITQGLSDRESMPRGHGMLFVFNQADVYPFWMNRMHFPLDIIWINDGVVVDIVTLPPPKFGEVPRTYTPKNAADTVLELNAGEAAERGLRVGAPVDGLDVF